MRLPATASNSSNTTSSHKSNTAPYQIGKPGSIPPGGTTNSIRSRPSSPGSISSKSSTSTTSQQQKQKWSDNHHSAVSSSSSFSEVESTPAWLQRLKERQAALGGSSSSQASVSSLGSAVSTGPGAFSATTATTPSPPSLLSFQQPATPKASNKAFTSNVVKSPPLLQQNGLQRKQSTNTNDAQAQQQQQQERLRQLYQQQLASQNGKISAAEQEESFDDSIVFEEVTETSETGGGGGLFEEVTIPENDDEVEYEEDTIEEISIEEVLEEDDDEVITVEEHTVTDEAESYYEEVTESSNVDEDEALREEQSHRNNAPTSNSPHTTSSSQNKFSPSGDFRGAGLAPLLPMTEKVDMDGAMARIEEAEDESETAHHSVSSSVGKTTTQHDSTSTGSNNLDKDKNEQPTENDTSSSDTRSKLSLFQAWRRARRNRRMAAETNAHGAASTEPILSKEEQQQQGMWNSNSENDPNDLVAQKSTGSVAMTNSSMLLSAGADDDLQKNENKIDNKDGNTASSLQGGKRSTDLAERPENRGVNVPNARSAESAAPYIDENEEENDRLPSTMREKLQPNASLKAKVENTNTANGISPLASVTPNHDILPTPANIEAVHIAQGDDKDVENGVSKDCNEQERDDDDDDDDNNKRRNKKRSLGFLIAALCCCFLVVVISAVVLAVVLTGQRSNDGKQGDNVLPLITLEPSTTPSTSEGGEFISGTLDPVFPSTTLPTAETSSTPTSSPGLYSVSATFRPQDESDQYAARVALSGTTAAISGLRTIDKAVFPYVDVFQESAGVWDLQQTLALSSINLASRAPGSSVVVSIDLQRSSGGGASGYLIIGNPEAMASGTSTASGAAYIYTLDPSGKLSQLGSTLGSSVSSQSYNEKFGASVATAGGVSGSTNRNRVVIGAPANDLANNLAGRVYSYDYINGTWVSATTNMTGMAANEQFGAAVDISSDGNTMIVGAPGGNYFRIFTYVSATWVNYFLGQSPGNGAQSESFGSSVAILSENFVAVGGPDAYNGSGVVRVYMFQQFTDSYRRLGAEIVGLAGERVGETDTIDGMEVNGYPVVFVGTAKGQVKRYDFNSSTETWTEVFVSSEGKLGGPVTSLSTAFDGASSQFLAGSFDANQAKLFDGPLLATGF